MTLEIEATAGEHIRRTAERMVAMVRTAKRVKCRFNDILLLADRDSTVDGLVAEFNQRCEARAKAYRESPEGKRAQAEADERRHNLQVAADELMAGLDRLDFSNVAALLDWLCAIEDARDHIGVTVDVSRIVATFGAHGYLPNVNCGADYKEDDPDNSARWLIGQALSVPYVPLVRHFTEQWKAKFVTAEGR